MRVRRLLLPALTAALALSCGISGNNPGGSSNPSKTNLEIRDVLVVPTDTAAVVTWNTTLQTVDTFEYGPSSGFTSRDVSAGLGTSHSLTLGSLTPDTEYSYQIIATSPSGPRAATLPAIFRTLPPVELSDSTAPVISQISASTTLNGAIVTWLTDDRSHGPLRYGTTLLYGMTADDAAPVADVQSHTRVLSGLLEATLYHFQIQATNRAGKTSVSTDQTFTTADRPWLEISPDTLRPAPGEEFTFAVGVRSVSNLAGLSVMLRYDPSEIEIESVGAGSFYTNNGGFLYLREVDDSQRGLLQYDFSWSINFTGGIATGTRANGGGDVAVVKALAVGSGAGTSGLDFDLLDENGDGKPETRLLDYNRQTIPFHLQTGTVIRQAK